MISHNWLEDYLSTKLDSATLPEMLTNTGLEVEGIHAMPSMSDKFVFARVVSAEAHPDSKKLSCCRVDVGSEVLDIVCGCTTVKSDITVIVAKVGAEMPNGLVIKSAELRGRVSNGMICSAAELGLVEDSSGIMIINDSIAPGTLARDLIKADIIYDVSLTPDRGDCFSIKGIAREALAVQLDRSINEYKASNLKNISYDKPRATDSYVLINIAVPNKKSNFTMQQRLLASGYCPQSFWVDYTQYYMHETGQPMHAFDAGKVAGTPYVRYAKDGESIRAIGGKDYKLTPDIMIIADDSGPIAIAGVIGGESTAVSESTKAVIMEVASFPKNIIARACRLLGLNTAASDRFSRGCDPLLVQELVAQIKQDFSSEITAINGYVQSILSNDITISYKEVTKILGDYAQPREMLSRLKVRGYGVILEDDRARVSVPSFRTDISLSVDVIEEALRISGHQLWPAADLSSVVSQPVIVEKNNFSDFLVANSFNEMVTYSFINPKWLESIGAEVNEACKLLNPMSVEMSLMRPTAIFGLLDRLSYNKNRQVNVRRVFELGRVFNSGGESKFITGILLPGPKSSWGSSETEDFFTAKNIVNNYLSSKFSVEYFQAIGPEWFHPHACSSIVVSGVESGFIGALHPKLCAQFNIDAAFAFEINLEKLLEKSSNEFTLADIPKFPSSRKDLSFYASKDISYSDITKTIDSLKIKEILKIELFDIYISDRISYSLGLTFQSNEITLSDSEIMSLVAKVVAALETELELELRGEICLEAGQQQKQT